MYCFSFKNMNIMKGKYGNLGLALACAMTLYSCSGAKGESSSDAISLQNDYSQIQEKAMDIKTIYLAGGCFWGTEHFFSMVHGVIEAEVGYANSKVPYPTYKEVCTGRTGAAETVKVVYDQK